MLRTAGVVIPVYIILVAVAELLHRRRQRQVCLKNLSEDHAEKLSMCMHFQAEMVRHDDADDAGCARAEFGTCGSGGRGATAACHQHPVVRAARWLRNLQRTDTKD